MAEWLKPSHNLTPIFFWLFHKEEICVIRVGGGGASCRNPPREALGALFRSRA